MAMIRKVFFELLLVTASVLIFRGLWSLLDEVEMLNSTGSFALMLGLGLMISAAVLYHYHKDRDTRDRSNGKNS